MDENRSFPYILWLCIIVLLLITSIIIIWQHSVARHKKVVVYKNFSVLPTPQLLPNIKLIDSQGKTFTNHNLQKKWSLLFFGFTNCKTICPAALSHLKTALQIMHQAQADYMPQVIFISIDPQRDNPELMANYLAQFNPRFIGVTGKKSELFKLAHKMGVVYMRTNRENKVSYDIAHTGAIMVINPQGKWVGLISEPYTSQEIANDLLQLQKKLKFTKHG